MTLINKLKGVTSEFYKELDLDDYLNEVYDTLTFEDVYEGFEDKLGVIIESVFASIREDLAKELEEKLPIGSILEYVSLMEGGGLAQLESFINQLEMGKIAEYQRRLAKSTQLRTFTRLVSNFVRNHSYIPLANEEDNIKKFEEYVNNVVSTINYDVPLAYRQKQGYVVGVFKREGIPYSN